VRVKIVGDSAIYCSDTVEPNRVAHNPRVDRDDDMRTQKFVSPSIPIAFCSRHHQCCLCIL